MKQKLGDRWALDASFYYSFLDEAMERAPFDFGGRDSVFYEGELSQVLAVQNIDYAWVWGYQFGVRSDISKNLHWLLHWSHPFGMDNQGNPLRHVNPFNATSTLSFNKDKFRTNIILRYNGSVNAEDMPFSESAKLHMYAINENGLPYSPSWYTINIHGSYHFSKNILLRVGLENLMDVRYRPYASGIAAPGRSMFFSMRMSV
jgi:hemoglobin/transferrin/lactoferrin receptor protein